MNAKSIFLALSLALGWSVGAQATLLNGKVVGFDYYYPSVGSAYSSADNGYYLVGNGVEIANVVDHLAQMDVSDRNLLISFLPPEYAFMNAEGNFNFASFNGFVIYDALNTIADFTSVTIDPMSNLAGFNDSRITFDANHIWVNWQGLAFDGNSSVLSLDLNRSQSVPEPASLVLVGVALAAIAAGLRRRY